MPEFDLIRRHFGPLSAQSPEARNLLDDAAILDIPASHSLVVTKDAMTEGIHYLPGTDPALIARKLLRVNLSDLAAMGATPLGHFLAVILPDTPPADTFLEQFCKGLREDLDIFSFPLLGGDTIQTTGPAGFSLTAMGTVPRGKSLSRIGAQPGDHIYVSGTLGDAAAGLGILKGTYACPRADDRTALINRHHLPTPRLTLGQTLVHIATAGMDISDGLASDIRQLCRASTVGAVIHASKLPLSSAFQACVPARDQITLALGGGDDYELLFTAPPERDADITELAASCDISLTHIGEITATPDIQLREESGKILAMPAGYAHFS